MEEVREISYIEAIEFLMPRHYSGRRPVITVAFGWFFGDELKAVCSFGKPASNSLCIGVCGKDHSKSVYELNRLMRIDELGEPLSKFVSKCLRMLRDRNWIIVSYADTGMSHNGYIYQATNFIYTGETKRRTDKYTEGNKHSRHYSNDNQKGLRKVRTAKHRYIYFCTGSKSLRKQWERSLKYKIYSYPKGENSNYTLGQFQKPEIVKST